MYIFTTFSVLIHLFVSWIFYLCTILTTRSMIILITNREYLQYRRFEVSIDVRGIYVFIAEKVQWPVFTLEHSFEPVYSNNRQVNTNLITLSIELSIDTYICADNNCLSSFMLNITYQRLTLEYGICVSSVGFLQSIHLSSSILIFR